MPPAGPRGGASTSTSPSRADAMAASTVCLGCVKPTASPVLRREHSGVPVGGSGPRESRALDPRDRVLTSQPGTRDPDARWQTRHSPRRPLRRGASHDLTCRVSPPRTCRTLPRRTSRTDRAVSGLIADRAQARDRQITQGRMDCTEWPCGARAPSPSTASCQLVRRRPRMPPAGPRGGASTSTPPSRADAMAASTVCLGCVKPTASPVLRREHSGVPVGGSGPRESRARDRVLTSQPGTRDPDARWQTRHSPRRPLRRGASHDLTCRVSPPRTCRTLPRRTSRTDRAVSGLIADRAQARDRQITQGRMDCTEWPCGARAPSPSTASCQLVMKRPRMPPAGPRGVRRRDTRLDARFVAARATTSRVGSLPRTCRTLRLHLDDFTHGDCRAGARVSASRDEALALEPPDHEASEHEGSNALHGVAVWRPSTVAEHSELPARDEETANAPAGPRGGASTSTPPSRADAMAASTVCLGCVKPTASPVLRREHSGVPVGGSGPRESRARDPRDRVLTSQPGTRDPDARWQTRHSPRRPLRRGASHDLTCRVSPPRTCRTLPRRTSRTDRAVSGLIADRAQARDRQITQGRMHCTEWPCGARAPSPSTASCQLVMKRPRMPPAGPRGVRRRDTRLDARFVAARATTSRVGSLPLGPAGHFLDELHARIGLCRGSSRTARRRGTARSRRVEWTARSGRVAPEHRRRAPRAASS
jgi:hypothetical protein